jgi:hypothetical protein
MEECLASEANRSKTTAEIFRILLNLKSSLPCLQESAVDIF